MSKWISYRILIMGLRLGLGMAMSVGVAKAQQAPKALTEADSTARAVVTDQAVPEILT